MDKIQKIEKNLEILEIHARTNKPIHHITNGEKFETHLLYEIITDVGYILNKIKDGVLIEIPESGIGALSDGYHTFNELYHHRAVLFATVCNLMPERAWKSKLHDTGDMFEGMFIVGIETPDGPATYHYDINPYWDMFKVEELERAPKWDGHTSTDAINRIATLFGDFVDAGPIIIEMDSQGIASYVMREELTTLLHTIEDHPEKTCPRNEGDSCDGCEYITESGNGCDSIKRRADYLIKNGVGIQQWISVSDRLPNEPGRYIVSTCNYRGEVGVFDLWFDYPEWYIDEDDDLYEFEVTHWMSLPEPPKKEGADNA